MTIVAFLCLRGGVGTTTSAVTIAYRLAQLGHKTLLIDLTTSGQCGLHFGLDMAHSAYDWLVAERPVNSCTATIQNGLSVLRSDDSTYVVETLCYEGRLDKEELAQKFRDLDRNGWIIVDCPRGGTLGEAVIETADVIVIPFRGDIASWDGMLNTMELIKRLDCKEKVIFLPTMIDSRLKCNRNILSEVQNLYKEQVAQAIPQRIAVVEAVEYTQTVWDFNGDGIENVRSAYSTLIDRLLRIGSNHSKDNEATSYQRQVEELQRQLTEAKEWRARHDIWGRMDALESRIVSLETSVIETAELAHAMVGRWGKLRSLFDDESNARL